ncbi:MAG: LysR family transcriptional regulator, partial [Gammaproteobacteria bacterium]|nr:LysR family transcriptional regulator [Gammaproteobacteria bacterium]
MDINAFKTFIEVARTRHFGHAAENLCISQSAVSARIRALEESLGTPLFVRERSNVHLSPEGEALLTHAKIIVTTWNRLRQEAGMPLGAATRVVIGGLSGLWDITLQTWLDKILAEEPGLSVAADIYGTTALTNRVINGTMDIAFVYDAPQSEDLVAVALREIRLRLVASQPGTNLRTALSDGYISVYWGANVAIRQA